jgi:hypothetical protein
MLRKKKTEETTETTGKKKGGKLKKLKRRLAVGAVSLTVVFGGAAGFATVNGVGENFSHGSRTGVVTEFGQKGLVCTSMNGTLTMTLPETVANGDTSTSFNFYATNPEIIRQLEKAEKKSKPVELTYSQSIVRPFCDGKGTNYEITAVTPVEGGKKAEDGKGKAKKAPRVS